MGRDELSAGEIFRMTIVENIVNAYRSRKAAEDWAKWATEHPQAARLLAQIEREINAD